MVPYAVYVHAALLDSLPKRGEQRRKILEFIRELRANPMRLGDYTDQDSSLRFRQIKIVGDYAITYWLDDPVKSVMIVDIRRAES